MELDRTIHRATADDLKYIDHLQLQFTNELGFLSHTALEQYVGRGHVEIGTENGDPAGYILHRPMSTAHPYIASIVQAAVQMDARRRALGLGLVQERVDAARENGSRIMQCWCAADIEAREFWKAAGFVEVARRDPVNRKGRDLILYRKALVELRENEISCVPLISGQYNRKTESDLQFHMFDDVPRVPRITTFATPRTI